MITENLSGIEKHLFQDSEWSGQNRTGTSKPGLLLPNPYNHSSVKPEEYLKERIKESTKFMVIG